MSSFHTRKDILSPKSTDRWLSSRMKSSPLYRNTFRFMKMLSSEQPGQTWHLRKQLNSGGWAFYHVTWQRTGHSTTWHTVGLNGDFRFPLSGQGGNTHHCSKYKEKFLKNLKTLTENNSSLTTKAPNELECTRKAVSKILEHRARETSEVSSEPSDFSAEGGKVLCGEHDPGLWTHQTGFELSPTSQGLAASNSSFTIYHK